MAAKGLGIDEGTSTIKAVEVVQQGGAILPVAATSIAATEDAGFGAAEWSAAMKAGGLKSSAPVAGLTGKDLVVRYHQVPAVAEWQLRQIMDFEIDEIQRQSGDPLSADYNLLQVSSDLTSDDIVLLALSREQRVEERTSRLKEAGLKVRYFTPNSLGLFHAFRVFGPAVSGDVVVCNIGRGSSDIVIIRDGELLYARTVNTAGDILTEALQNEFNVSWKKAETLKRDLGDLRPRGQRKGLTSQQEKVSYALEAAAGRLNSMISSTVGFAKSQIQLNQLEPTRYYVTGGTADMPGLAEYLSSSLGAPVDLFDPLGEAGLEVDGPASSGAMTVALGLAVMGADSDAYAVEVLGKSMKRAKEFKEKHLFSVLAVLAVLAYLGFSFVQLKADYALATRDKSRIEKTQRDRKRQNSSLEALMEERASLMELVDVLEKKKAAGIGFASTVSILAKHLPEDLWIEKVELEFKDKRRGASDKSARPPIVKVEGAGKSRGDRNVREAYSEFIANLQTETLLGGDRLVDTPSTQRDSFDFALELDYLAKVAPDAPEGEEDTEEDG